MTTTTKEWIFSWTPELTSEEITTPEISTTDKVKTSTTTSKGTTEDQKTQTIEASTTSRDDLSTKKSTAMDITLSTSKRTTVFQTSRPFTLLEKNSWKKPSTISPSELLLNHSSKRTTSKPLNSTASPRTLPN